MRKRLDEVDISLLNDDPQEVVSTAGHAMLPGLVESSISGTKVKVLYPRSLCSRSLNPALKCLLVSRWFTSTPVSNSVATTMSEACISAMRIRCRARNSFDQ